MIVTPVVTVNGVRCPVDRPHVFASDRGLTLSDGVFETMRARGGVIFRLDRHLARLGDALRRLAIPEPSALHEWVLAAVADAYEGAATDTDGESGADLTTSAPHAHREASIRLTVTRGPGPGGLVPPRDPRPTAIIAVNPMPAFPAAVYDNGLAAVIATGRRNERAESSGLKTLAYTDGVLALLAAHRAGAGEALFLDTEEHCSEATASNLFVSIGDALLTPPVSCGALPGITRATVIEIAGTLGIPVVERAFGVDLLLAAPEAFFTSSLRGIAPFVRLDTSNIGDGRPGPVTRRIASAYAALIASECRPSLSARA